MIRTKPGISVAYAGPLTGTIYGGIIHTTGQVLTITLTNEIVVELLDQLGEGMAGPAALETLIAGAVAAEIAKHRTPTVHAEGNVPDSLADMDWT